MEDNDGAEQWSNKMMCIDAELDDATVQFHVEIHVMNSTSTTRSPWAHFGLHTKTKQEHPLSILYLGQSDNTILQSSSLSSIPDRQHLPTLCL